MPTTLCPACNSDVGEHAPSCPRCGLAFAPGAVVSPVPLRAVSGVARSPVHAPTPPRSRVPSLSSPPRGAGPLATPPGVDPYVGTVVAGRFRVEELIGAGGMGKVYRATHLGLDKVVCLKTLKPSLLEDETVVGRFEREAKAASRLDHPNSIQVLDFGQDERGQLFLVMEYVAGKDLRRLLNDEFPFSERRLGHIVAQVLAALSRAHSMGVIHRDLKPENILVSPRPEDPDTVKVLDFGIAKILDPHTPGLTRQDMVCGTPEYMSPEQAMGRDVDARADLYAVGVILFQCATGRRPFEGRSAMEILQKQVYEKVPALKAANPEATVSPALEALIFRAMDKDPAKRPQTADDFRRELLAATGLVATPPALASAPPKPESTPAKAGEPRAKKTDAELDAQRALPKSRAPLVAGVVALLCALAAGWYYTRGAGAGDDNDDDLVQEPQKVELVAGGLTKNDAYDLIESHYAQVKHCFERARRRIEDADGEMVLSIAIGVAGTVTEANISQSSIEQPKLESCLVQHARLWTFPKPRAPMLLSYTYKFRKH